MAHPIHRVRSFQVVAPYMLRVEFDDDSEQVINFEPMLAGELYRPLKDLALFDQVRIDPEVHTLVWPNGADFDPATLHDWPEHVAALTERTRLIRRGGLWGSRMRRWLVLASLIGIAACLVVVIVWTRERPDPTPREIERAEIKRPLPPQTSDLLRNWRHAKRITLDVADAPFEDVLAELERQSGVRIRGEANAKTVSVKLKDAPLWQAVAEVSIAGKTGFVTNHLDDEVHFSRLLSEHVYERYQIIGPFHLGLYWSSEILEKPRPLIALLASAIAREGKVRRVPTTSSGISNVCLEEPGGRRHQLETVEVRGKQDSGRRYCLIPDDLLNRRVNLHGVMDGEVYLNPQVITVPVVAGQPTEFAHFGGITVKITKMDRVGDDRCLEYTVHWDSNLKGDDAKFFQEMLKRQKEMLIDNKEELNPEEVAKWYKWMDAKTADLRTLHVIKHELLDGEQKVIPHPRQWMQESDSIQGELYFAKESQPKELRLTLADKKLVTAVFEFKNVFSRPE